MSNKMEWTNASYKKTDDSHKHNVKQKKLDSKDFILHDSIAIKLKTQAISMWWKKEK